MRAEAAPAPLGSCPLRPSLWGWGDTSPGSFSIAGRGAQRRYLHTQDGLNFNSQRLEELGSGSCRS